MKKTDAAALKRPGKKERSRIKIMHAAKGLFEEYGMDSVTFQMIADRADMCRTTVFNHFSSIDELMLALTDQEIDDLKEFFNREGLPDIGLTDAFFGSDIRKKKKKKITMEKKEITIITLQHSKRNHQLHKKESS